MDAGELTGRAQELVDKWRRRRLGGHGALLDAAQRLLDEAEQNGALEPLIALLELPDTDAARPVNDRVVDLLARAAPASVEPCCSGRGERPPASGRALDALAAMDADACARGLLLLPLERPPRRAARGGAERARHARPRHRGAAAAPVRDPRARGRCRPLPQADGRHRTRWDGREVGPRCANWRMRTWRRAPPRMPAMRWTRSVSCSRRAPATWTRLAWPSCATWRRRRDQSCSTCRKAGRRTRADKIGPGADDDLA